MSHSNNPGRIFARITNERLEDITSRNSGGNPAKKMLRITRLETLKGIFGRIPDGIPEIILEKIP